MPVLLLLLLLLLLVGHRAGKALARCPLLPRAPPLQLLRRSPPACHPFTSAAGSSEEQGAQLGCLCGHLLGRAHLALLVEVELLAGAAQGGLHTARA